MRRPLSQPLIEPLESRIAPAGITFTATNYTDTYPKTGQPILQFIHASDPTLTGANLSIAEAAGQNPEVYFIKLSAGQDLKVPTPVGTQDLVNVTQGTVVAFFTDINGDGKVGSSELTGLALGNKVAVALGTGVSNHQVNGTGPYYGGDVVTDYNDLTGSIGGSNESGGTADSLLPNTITSFSAPDPIAGALIAGGAVSKINATGSLGEILTGTAANAYTFSFEGVPNATGHTTLAVSTPAPGVAGPSLSNVTVGSIIGIPPSAASPTPLPPVIHLGDGGAGAAGGSISGLTLLDDSTGFTVIAGHGGDGGLGKTAGGGGGSISGVVVNGPPTPPLTTPPTPVDSTPNSHIVLTAGAGGNGVLTAKGGAGGTVQNVFIDYDSASVTDPSANYLADDVTAQGGAGGNGGTAGSGGGLNGLHILTATPHDLTQVEFQLLGGAGGNSPFGGKAGSGGSVTNSQVNDAALPQIDPVTLLPDDTGPTSPTNTQALIQAGAGGIAAVKGTGGAGGSVGSLTLEGFNFQITSGAGGNGVSTGGAGGAVSSLIVLGSSGALPGDDFHVQSLDITTGAGGNGSAGKGGAGGSVTTLTVNNADFGTSGYQGAAGFQILTGAGGSAGKGAGGAGGSISTVRAMEIDFVTFSHPLGNTGSLNITTGHGGASANAQGGAGGAMSNVTVVGSRLVTSSVTSGAGGAGGAFMVKGTGGSGGAINSVSIHTVGDLYPIPATTVSAGTGILFDPNAAFTAEVAVGDLVENTLTGAQATIQNIVSDQELILANNNGLGGNIFAAGDPYQIVDTGTGTTNLYTGAAADSGDPSQDSLIDSHVNFVAEGVQPGDVVADIPSAGAIFNGALPAFATVTAVSAHQLTLSSPIARVGDQYSFTTLGAAQPSATTIIAANANFLTEGVVSGDTVQDLTATQAADQAAAAAGITILPPPVTSLITAVTAHSLTIVSPISVLGDQYDFLTLLGSHSTMNSGMGGAGNLTGAGGAGGNINNSSLVSPSQISFLGGNGGSGGVTAAAGAGGALNGDGAFSSNSSGSMQGGNGGAGGLKPGAGGGVSGADVQVLTDLSLIGGNGSAGGAGGSILSSGFSGVLQSDDSGFNPPSGNITIHGGVGGSSAIGSGGAGGSVSTLTGFISNGLAIVDPLATAITQFDGGQGGNGITAGGHGGSVNNVRFYGGGGSNVIFFMNAGDGGNSTSGKTGATGGSVTNIGGGAYVSGTGDPNFSIDPNTDFHHISAGNGGNAGPVAKSKGGLGGSVSNVYVNAAIGMRTGEAFGFDLASAGGISAGAGGTGITPGQAGNVTNIVADAIASIVAGHLGATGVSTGSGGVFAGDALLPANLATKVDGIILNVPIGQTTIVPPSLVHQFILSLTVNGVVETATLPTNATDIQVASAINAIIVPPQQAANVPAGEQGVSVISNSNGYVVTFNDPGAGAGTNSSNTILAWEPGVSSNGTPIYSSYIPATAGVQSVQVFGLSPFSLTFSGDTTTPLPANASPTQVKTALNQLNSVQSIGGVAAVNSSTVNGNPAYSVTFTNGFEPLIIPNFVITETHSTVVTSQSTVLDVQTLTFPTRGDIDPVQMSTANLVGSIDNILRPHATTFAFTPLVVGSSFRFGDAPVDGLIAALSLTSYKNFVPEAFVTADSSGNAVLIDNFNS